MLLLIAAICLQGTADLEAKGVKLKKLKDGTVTELSVGGKVPMTAEDYAAVGKLTTLVRLNLSAEHLSRILRELSVEGLIDVRGRRVQIPDVDRLRDWAGRP